MRETIEIINMTKNPPEPESKHHTETDAELDEPNYILRTQLFVCLFAAAVLYFTWRQGGVLWQELSQALMHVLEDGISFSGQDELTRFTDEVRGLWGSISDAFSALH